MGASTFSQGAVPRQLPETGLEPCGHGQDWPGDHPTVQGSAEYTEYTAQRSQDVTVGTFRERILYILLKDRW